MSTDVTSAAPGPTAGPAAPAHVGRKVRAGLSWNVLGAVGTNATRVVVLAVLGRTLSSADFGVVAAAVSLTTILHSVRDIGVGTALVQRRELAPAHVESAVAFSLLIGFALSLVLAVTAPLLADLFGIPASTQVLRAIGALFAIRGLSVIARMMAQRAMMFRASAIIETAAFAAGSLASIVLAVLGAGPWALVVGYLLEELVATGLYLRVCPTPLTLRMSRPHLRDLLGFGARQTAATVIGTLGHNLDNIVVGNALGEVQLGFYTRAYDLIRLPSVAFATVVGSVLFPAFARIQDDPARLAAQYRRVTFVNALVLFPASAVLIVAAPEVIRVLMGPGWDTAVLPFRILAVAMLFRTSQRLGALVATAAGRAGAIAVAYAIYAASVLVGALVALPWGVPGVAATTAFALLVCYVACSVPALQVTRMSGGALLRAHLPGLALGGVILGVGHAGATALRASRQPTVVVLMAVLAGAAIVGLLTIAVAAWARVGDFTWLRDELDRLRRRRGVVGRERL